MMLLDHIAVGILLPNTLKGFQNFPSVAISILSSVLPDIPIIFSGWKGSIDYLSHRSFTHSFFFAPLFSIIPVLSMYLIFKSHLENNIFELYLLSIISFCIHLFLDLLTPYGTQILFPISKKKFSLDFFHCIDIIFMTISICVIGIFLVELKTNHFFNSMTTLIAFSLYIFYGGITATIKFIILKKFYRYIEIYHTNARYLRTIPRTFWRWKGISKESDKFIVITKGTTGIEHKIYKIETDLNESIKKDSYYKKFMKYARFPVILKRKNIYSIINLIYSPKSYRLNFYLDDKNNIIRRELTGFDMADKEI